MSQFAPKHSIQRIEDHYEVHYVVSGMYEPDAVIAFLTELARAAYPFIANGKSWSVLGDLTKFVPQSREVTRIIEQGNQEGAKSGLARLAYISPPPLVSSQHRRMAGGVDVQIFKTKPEALRWLRGLVPEDAATQSRATTNLR